MIVVYVEEKLRECGYVGRLRAACRVKLQIHFQGFSDGDRDFGRTMQCIIKMEEKLEEGNERKLRASDNAAGSCAPGQESLDNRALSLNRLNKVGYMTKEPRRLRT